MLDAITTALHQSVEWQQYQKYGLWNTNFIAALGVIITSLMEVWGLWQQGKTVWKHRSGESVSVATFNYTTWYFLLCGVYGLFVHGMAAAFSGFITAVVQLPIIIGLARFKRFVWWEKVLACTLPLMPIAMVLFPAQWRGGLFVTFSLSVIFAWGAQPLELWRTGKTGAFDIRLFLVYFVTTLVWMAYVISVGDLPLIVNQTITTMVIVVTIALWGKNRLQEPDPPRLLVWAAKAFT